MTLPVDKTGTIVAAFGRHYEVAFPGEASLNCVPRGKKSLFACGDHVKVLPTGPGEGVIVGHETRASLLYRSDEFREKLIAANLTQVIVVVATEPGFNPELVTRCLIAAEDQGLKALILLNKVDLIAHLDQARAQLECFRAAGYRVLEVSAFLDLASLAEALSGERSILVGQSGMGKSSLINVLVPEARAETRAISLALDSGKHTTTYSRIYSLPGQGEILDSPGLQVFGLAHVGAERLTAAFPEFREHLGTCRFRDCAHGEEPGCSLHMAMQQGGITTTRMEHYRRIRAELTALPEWQRKSGKRSAPNF